MMSPLPEKLPRWRSVLFVPAQVKRYVETAHTRGAATVDGKMIDLPVVQRARMVLGGPQ